MSIYNSQGRVHVWKKHIEIGSKRDNHKLPAMFGVPAKRANDEQTLRNLAQQQEAKEAKRRREILRAPPQTLTQMVNPTVIP